MVYNITMTQKEILEINLQRSDVTEEIPAEIDKILSEDPEIIYTKLNYEDDSSLIKSIVSSSQPITSPFFLALRDGKVFNSFTNPSLITNSDI
jgi:hypothetical protein